MQAVRVDADPSSCAWHAAPEWPGVRMKTLDPDGNAGLLRFELGRRTPEHTHPDSDLHLWVVEGKLRVDGQELSSGSYVFVPAGSPHRLHADAIDGCTVFFVRTRRDASVGDAA